MDVRVCVDTDEECPEGWVETYIFMENSRRAAGVTQISKVFTIGIGNINSGRDLDARVELEVPSGTSRRRLLLLNDFRKVDSSNYLELTMILPVKARPITHHWVRSTRGEGMVDGRRVKHFTKRIRNAQDAHQSAKYEYDMNKDKGILGFDVAQCISDSNREAYPWWLY